MFKIIISVLLLISLNAPAAGLQLGFGSLTPHFSTSKKNYCNQWNNSGIIANKTYYIRYMSDAGIGLTYLEGNDSICSPIKGLLLHYRFSQSEWYDLGMAFGGYAYDEGNWEEHARETPTGIDAPEPVQVEYFGRRVVPVLALDFGIHLVKRSHWSIKLNNIITPVIFNHSLAFEWRF